MRTYLAIMTMGLRFVLNFRGRSARIAYWPYVLSLLLLLIVLGQILAVRAMRRFMPAVEAYSAANPGAVQIDVGPGSAAVQIAGEGPPEMSAFFLGFLQGVIVFTLLFLALIAAATVRRLHDSGRSGAWALLPLPFLATGMAGIGYLFTSAEPTFATFGALFVNNILYLGCVGWLIFMLAKPGDVRVNRYGDPAPGLR